MNRNEECPTPQWIRVEDTLPEHARRVLACVRSFNAKFAVVAHLKEYQWHIEGGPMLGTIVTHWMPLPQIPSE